MATIEDIDRLDEIIVRLMSEEFYIGLTDFRNKIGGEIASGREGVFKSIPANDLFTILDQRLAIAVTFRNIQQIALEKDYGDGIKKKIFILAPNSVKISST